MTGAMQVDEVYKIGWMEVWVYDGLAALCALCALCSHVHLWLERLGQKGEKAGNQSLEAFLKALCPNQLL